MDADFFEDDDDLGDFGFFEGECAGCDVYTRLDDVGLCEECSAKLDRDMIRERDWDYSATAWVCPKEKREELRDLIIKEYGAKLELIAPSESEKKRAPNKRKGKHRGHRTLAASPRGHRQGRRPPGRG